MNDHDLTALAYLRFVLAELDVSPSALAKMAGVASTTLTRRLNDPGHKYSLSMTTINKIEAASGLSYAPFAANQSQTELKQGFLQHYVYKDAESYDGSDFYGTPVVGEVAAGEWKELSLVGLPRSGVLLVSRTYAPKDCFCLKVAGTSINKIAKEGDYLFCVRRFACGGGLRSGDCVIAERKSADGSLVEVTAKRLKASESGGWELHPESTDPKWQSPLKIKSVDDTTVAEIVAVVLYVIRDPVPAYDDA